MKDSNHPITAIAIEALSGLKWYLTHIELADYQRKLEILSDSTIGQHTRHIIEFYVCLIEQSALPDSIINYAARKRDYLIESQPDHALQLIDQIVERIIKLAPSQTCMLDCSEHGQDGLLVHSTIGRELIYNIEHTVHHLAIIKIALRSEYPELRLPVNFGVAPSTIRHRLEACAQ